MKRIVQCPKCETKLSVFDLGKPISQKCPKCTNTFEVTSEGAVETPSAADAPEREKTAPAPAPAPAASKPSAPADIPPDPVVVESGISFRHVLAIIALLLIAIAVQVWAFKQSQARFNRLEKQVYDLAAQVQKLKIHP